ncbi:MAG: hypothetical protein ACRDJK_13000 [Actinomycetota bacterium]
MLSNTENLPAGALRRDPDEVLPRLLSRGLLRDCADRRVYVVGPGRTASGGPVVTVFTDLDRFWDRAFRSCGGQLWGFQPQLTLFPASGPLPPRPNRRFSARATHSRLRKHRWVGRGMQEFSSRQASKVLPEQGRAWGAIEG